MTAQFVKLLMCGLLLLPQALCACDAAGLHASEREPVGAVHSAHPDCPCLCHDSSPAAPDRIVQPEDRSPSDDAPDALPLLATRDDRRVVFNSDRIGSPPVAESLHVPRYISFCALRN
jgi:hypothetical protein